MMILFSMILAGEANDAIPPMRPLQISISALAQRFGVSRVHVRTLLRDAEAAGLIERTSERRGHIVIWPRRRRPSAHRPFCLPPIVRCGRARTPAQPYERAVAAIRPVIVGLAL